jgi:hypothetical protein
MARGECRFRKRDVKEALKATRDAGIDVSRIEIDKDGRIIIIAGKPNGANPNRGAHEWDEE